MRVPLFSEGVYKLIIHTKTDILPIEHTGVGLFPQIAHALITSAHKLYWSLIEHVISHSTHEQYNVMHFPEEVNWNSFYVHMTHRDSLASAATVAMRLDTFGTVEGVEYTSVFQK